MQGDRAMTKYALTLFDEPYNAESAIRQKALNGRHSRINDYYQRVILDNPLPTPYIDDKDDAILPMPQAERIICLPVAICCTACRYDLLTVRSPLFAPDQSLYMAKRCSATHATYNISTYGLFMAAGRNAEGVRGIEIAFQTGIT